MQLSPVGQFVSDNLARLGNRAFVVPTIPPRQLGNAATSIANGISHHEVIGVLDITIWGSAKDGFVFTNDSVWIKPFLGSTRRYNYRDLQSASGGTSFITIHCTDGTAHKIDSGTKDTGAIVIFLNELIAIAQDVNRGSDTPAAVGGETVARCSGCNAKFSGAIGTVINCEWCRKPVKFETPPQ